MQNWRMFGAALLAGGAIAVPDVVVAITTLLESSSQCRALSLGMGVLHLLIALAALPMLLDFDSLPCTLSLSVTESLKALGFALSGVGHGFMGAALVVATVGLQCSALAVRYSCGESLPPGSDNTTSTA